MSDFPRPAKSMSAPLNGFALTHHPVRAGVVALALAATMLPSALALARGKAHQPATAHATARAQAKAPTHKASTASDRAAAKRGARPAESMRFPEPRGQVQVSKATVRNHGPLRARPSVLVARPAARQHEEPHARRADTTVDRSVEDRVHAWYSARRAGGMPASTQDEAAGIDVPHSVPAATPDNRKFVPQPDLSPVARKATSADFDRAVQKQAETIRAAAALKNSRSTADDDAAFAQASNLPSTAPTERVPSPFLHGDLLAGAVPQKQAKLLARAPAAPITRVDPRGDAEVLSAAAESPAAVPVHLSAGDAVPFPAPKPATILRTPAPAAVAVLAAANTPKLDPSRAESMTQQAMADDDEAAPIPGKATRVDAPAKLNPMTPVDLSMGPLVKVNLYDNAGKLILLPAMKGSHEILVHQNQMAISDGLDRIEDDRQLGEMHRLKLLVPLPDTDGMYPDGHLPMNRRLARPWTVRFLNDLSRAHFERFHTPLIITSAVRTVAFQRHLVLTNGNAAPPTGEVASPHLYGQAVDIAKHSMSMTEIAWMRSYLTPVESAGKIDVEEEFQQACFHLSVYRRYLGLPAPRSAPAPQVAPSRVLQQVKAAPPRRRRIPTALLATGLR